MREMVFSVGAAGKRPLEEWLLTSATKSTIFYPDGSCFLERSAGLTCPRISCSSIEASLTLCWTQRARVSMCRNLPKPARLQSRNGLGADEFEICHDLRHVLRMCPVFDSIAIPPNNAIEDANLFVVF